MNTLPNLSPWATRVLESPLTHALTGAGVLLLDLFTSKFLLVPILFVVPVSLAAPALEPSPWALTAGGLGVLAVTSHRR